VVLIFFKSAAFPHVENLGSPELPAHRELSLPHVRDFQPQQKEKIGNAPGAQATKMIQQ
jgi:hypothetical protein